MDAIDVRLIKADIAARFLMGWRLVFNPIRKEAVMRNFRELQVWEKAHQFTIGVFTVTQNFPRTEVYGLTSQIRRASASIPTNIAEGCGRNGNAEFVHFLQIAMGSANEVDYQLLLSKDLGYLKAAEYENLSRSIAEIQRMLASFIRKTRALPTNRSYPVKEVRVPSPKP